MPRPASDKRARLTAAAATLAYTRGLDRSTLADIAEEAGIAPGSVYYYFKTKEEAGRAVVESVRARFASGMEEWGRAEDPRDRLSAYLDMYLEDAAQVTAHGCPIGSLSSELRKASPDLGDAAADVLRATVGWAAEQFEALGYSAEAARARALHLVTGVQGAAALANALGDAEPLEREAAHLKRWIARSGGTP